MVFDGLYLNELFAALVVSEKYWSCSNFCRLAQLRSYFKNDVAEARYGFLGEDSIERRKIGPGTEVEPCEVKVFSSSSRFFYRRAEQHVCSFISFTLAEGQALCVYASTKVIMIDKNKDHIETFVG